MQLVLNNSQQENQYLSNEYPSFKPVISKTPAVNTTDITKLESWTPTNLSTSPCKLTQNTEPPKGMVDPEFKRKLQ